MKAVMISIRPEWCEKIANGEKTVEVRKTRPKLEPPFKCYIYCTQNSVNNPTVRIRTENKSKTLLLSEFWTSSVIGEFVCDAIFDCDADSIGLFDKNTREYIHGSCMNYEQIFSYSKGFLPLFGWHISNLVIFDEPKQLTDFMKEPCDFSASCGTCVHSIWSENNYSQFVGCSFDIKRAPQSWCYVEGVINGQ